MEAGSRILNVSSIASFCPTPRMTVYSATKAYVSAYTIGAAEELKAKGITVTAVCPGPMATEFLAVGHVVDSRPFELLQVHRADPAAALKQQQGGTRIGFRQVGGVLMLFRTQLQRGGEFHQSGGLVRRELLLQLRREIGRAHV